MNKFFYMLVFMLIGSFAFANNSNQTEFSNKSVNCFETHSIDTPQFSENFLGTCYITLNGYDGDGNLVYSVVLEFTGATSDQCNQIEAKIKKALSIL